jgi:hypothetical protein
MKMKKLLIKKELALKKTMKEAKINIKKYPNTINNKFIGSRNIIIYFLFH